MSRLLLNFMSLALALGGVAVSAPADALEPCCNIVNVMPAATAPVR